jgi:redox-sensing transcriptional repressor
MAEALGVHPTQVRKDLSMAGCVGRPKTGHKVGELLAAIEGFLHWDNRSDAFLVGAGSLGTALMNYTGFEKAGARIVAAFDTNPARVGLTIGETKVLPMESFTPLVQRMHIAVGILAVPGEAAQATADLMVGSGIRAIWNFAPVTLDVPTTIIVENLELFASLALLLRRLSDRELQAVES